MQGKGGRIGQGYKFSSVASRFKRQLADLMDALHTMEPHYIRCIKPNSRNRRASLFPKPLAHYVRPADKCVVCCFRTQRPSAPPRRLSEFEAMSTWPES